MLKNITQLEVIIEGKPYHFTCDPISPLPHVKEALFQFQKYIGLIEDQGKAKQQEENQTKEEA